MSWPVDNPRHLVIIGGGFSGTVLAWRLLKQALSATTVTLIERSERYGGVAATRSDQHLLNVPGGRMSALPEDPDHFLRFAAAHVSRADAGSYLPRSLYRRYLFHLWAEAREAGLNHVADEAIQVRRLDSRRRRFMVVTAGGKSYRADEVVLATGAGRPAAPAVFDAVAQHPAWQVDPWGDHALTPPASNAGVALIGTAQTAMDAALALTAHGYRGPITAVSRHGLIPRQHRPGDTGAPIDSIDPAIDPTSMPIDSAVAAHRWLRTQIAGCRDWRDAFDALRPHTNALWGQLPIPVKARLLRHARVHWDVCRHRIAPQVDRRITALRRAGQLRIWAGRVTDCHAVDDGQLMIHVQGRGTDQMRTLRVARAINCTGLGRCPAGTAEPLIAQMLDAGLVQRDPLDLGVQAEQRGDEQPIHIVGALERGRRWESSAVPELAQRCRALARTVQSAEPRQNSVAWAPIPANHTTAACPACRGSRSPDRL